MRSKKKKIICVGEKQYREPDTLIGHLTCCTATNRGTAKAKLHFVHAARILLRHRRTGNKANATVGLHSLHSVQQLTFKENGGAGVSLTKVSLVSGGALREHPQTCRYVKQMKSPQMLPPHRRKTCISEFDDVPPYF